MSPVHQQSEKDWKNDWLKTTMVCVGGGRSSSTKVEWCSAPRPIPFGAPCAAASHWHSGSTVPPLPWSPCRAPEWLSGQNTGHLGDGDQRRPEQIKTIAQRCTWSCPLLLGLWRKHFSCFSNVASPLYDLTRKRGSWDWTLVHEEVQKLLGFEVGIYQALGPIHPDNPSQVEWGFTIPGL